MMNNLGDMVAVAAGSTGDVARWARRLRRAAIPYYTATVNWLGDDSDPREAELWVAEDLADEARRVIQTARPMDRNLIW